MTARWPAIGAALNQTATAKALLENLQKRLDSIRAQAEAGEMDPLAVAAAEVAFGTGQQNQLDAILKAQQALGQLEDAVQSPLTLPPAALDAAEQQFPRFEMKRKQLSIGIVVVALRRRRHLCAHPIAPSRLLPRTTSGNAPSVVSVQVGALKRMTLHHYVEGYGTVEPAPATPNQPAAGAPLAPPTAGVVATSRRGGRPAGEKRRRAAGIEFGRGDMRITRNRRWRGSRNCTSNTILR